MPWYLPKIYDTGPDISPINIKVTNFVTVNSTDVWIVLRIESEELTSYIEGVKVTYGINKLVAIYFTNPSAINSNGKLYDDMNILFLMVTTERDLD